MARWRTTGIATLALAGAALLAGCGQTGPDAGSGGRGIKAMQETAATGTVTPFPTYQVDNSRRGALPGASLSLTGQAWSTDLGAEVHGAAVAADGLIFAATENNRVVALSPTNGHVVWSRTIGPPLRNAQQAAGCGDIDTLGITSTPAVNTRSHLVYVAGEISQNGRVHHQLVALSTRTGAVRLSRNIDPPLPRGERPVHLLQRDAIGLANGRVYVGFGGNDGDCGTYHGWLVSTPQAGGTGPKTAFMVDPGGQGGAIWQAGGGPAVTSRGAVLVNTGNSNPFPSSSTDPGRYAESVVKLTPTLKVLASFKDRAASQDADLSTTNPVLLPGGFVFTVGKTDIAYVLRVTDLGKVFSVSGVCGANPDGGPAYDASTRRMFVPCRNGGLQVVDLANRRLGPKLSGANSSPLIVGSRIFAASDSNARLYQYDASSGSMQNSFAVGTSIPHFATPTTAYGLVLLPTDSGVTAFH